MSASTASVEAIPSIAGGLSVLADEIPEAPGITTDNEGSATRDAQTISIATLGGIR